MFEVKVTKGDSDSLSQSGTRAGQVIGCFADKAEAEAMAAEMAECGLHCKVQPYRLKPEEAKRAAMMASFGQKYVPKHVEPAGKWVTA